MGFKFCVIVVVVSLCYVAVSQVGNTCYMKATGNPGTCKISSDCPEAEDAAKNGVGPTVCGLYQLTVPIVCCEGDQFDGGNFESPSRPVVSNNGPDSFSNVNYNENRQPAEESDIFFNNNDNGDSIVYPGDNNINNDNNRVRKSEAKCQEYSKPLSNVLQAIPLVTDTEVVSLNVEKCDNNGVPLIVGGEPAALGEFPFMAALGFLADGVVDWRCGATLISEYYVVTAAHCTFSRDADQPVVVRLGEIDLTNRRGGPTHSDYNIVNITTHPEYSYPLRYNDIALIRVDRSIKFSKYIRPACLYTNTYLEDSLSIATGYGKNEFAASENINKLMKVALSIFDNDRCQQTFGSDRRSLPRGVVSTMLCAGDLKGGRDTCQGDSGGPLLITDKNNQCKFHLIGVTSFGKSCGEPNTPAVYTKVAEYVTWIESIVW